MVPELLKVRKYPDPVLAMRCEPIAEVDDTIRKLAFDMHHTLLVESGIGLAAPQVGHALRMFVVDINTGDPRNGTVTPPYFFINPKVVKIGKTHRNREGCLSLPGVYEFVDRAPNVHVKATNLAGVEFEMEATGLLAICIQHENDHLDGHTLVDRVGPLTRKMILKQLPSLLPPPYDGD